MNQTRPPWALRLTCAIFALTGTMAVAAEPAPVVEDPVLAFTRLRDGQRCHDEQQITLLVDTSRDAGLQIDVDAASGIVQIRYPMAFNQLTEGWSWRPQANAASEDYYRFKYLPLGSAEENRPAYRYEDKIGDKQDIQVRWRYDYFLAFENLYDFYPRSADDDAGFVARVTLPPDEAGRLIPGNVRMAVRGRFTTPCTAESTTFWKATHAAPVDFTLKKRYLIGILDEVIYFEGAHLTTLARLRRP